MGIETSFAQKSIYFTDYVDAPPTNSYRMGYIVNLKGDTIIGKIKNGETLRSLATPDWNKNADTQPTSGEELKKIAFLPDGLENNKEQILLPEDIKAFGFQSSYVEQQVVELDPPIDNNGLNPGKSIHATSSKKYLYEDIHLLQKLTYNGWSCFESKHISSSNQVKFIQRLVEGKITLYADPERMADYYIIKSNNPSLLVYVDYTSTDFFSTVFGDSEEVQKAVKREHIMKSPANLLRVTGLYNMEADRSLFAINTDYVVLNSRDILKGNLKMEGASSLSLGIINKANFIMPDGHKINLKGEDIKRIVKYVNNIPLVFDSYTSPLDGKKVFYPLLADGKIKLYYDARNMIFNNQKLDESPDRTLKSYLIAKGTESPVLISNSNFADTFKSFFSISAPPFSEYMKTHPSKNSYSNLTDLVRMYNKVNN